ncbi:MAG: PAS domain S-box protein, partial [Candidatus Bipolaricaulia bacterium]
MQFEDLDEREQFEYLPEAIFLEDFEGNILDVNNEACRLLGYSKEELLERKVEDIVPEEQPVFMAEEIDQATQASDPIETVNLRKDGTEIPVELRGRIIEIDGEERSLVSVREISDRKRAKRKLKQSQKRLKWALEGTKAGIWDWNVQTGDVVFNERWAEIVGYSLEELQPATIETWEELAHPEDLKRSKELLEKHFDGETEVYECEARMKHKNGDWVWVLDRGRVVEWNEEGEPTRMVGTHQDITERKKTEQALNEERNKLRNLHNAVDELQQQDTEEDVVQTGVEVAENNLGFEICGIMLLREDRLLSEALSPGVSFKEPINFQKDEGVAGQTLQRGETVWLDDVRDFSGAREPAERFRAIISSPIGEIGVLQIISEEVAGFSEQDVELAEILAGHLRAEISRVRLEEDLRQQAIHD